MRRFLSDEDLWTRGHEAAIRTPGRAAWPAMWQYRSVDGSWDKVGPVERYCDPAGPEDLVRVLGTAHGEYLQERIERMRRGRPDGEPEGSRRCWGSMIWRLNDSWPIIYWSAIDYYLAPKIPYYFVKRAHVPVLVCFERTPDALNAWIVNDSPEPVAGDLIVRRMRFDGTVRGTVASAVGLAPGEARRCLSTEGLGPISLREEFLHATFGDLSATYLLTGERYLHLPQATLVATASAQTVRVSTDVFARQVALSCDDDEGTVFSDNYFDMPPGAVRTIDVLGNGRAVSVAALNASAVAAPRTP